MSKSKLEANLISTLVAKQSLGESRHKAKLDGSAKNKVFSVKSMDKYCQIARDFARYCDSKEAGLKRKKDAIKYIDPYLQSLKDKGYSAWTQQTTRSALAKIYGEDHSTIELDKKERQTITRSRKETANCAHFSEANNEELVNFCRHTGLRRSELEALVPEQLVKISGQYYLHIKGKGGKERYAEVLNNDKRTINRILATKPKQKVWPKVHSAANIHRYRAEYAKALYEKYARKFPIKGAGGGPAKDTVPKKDIYVCRKDMRGKRFDKRAMKITSKNLGHNRIDVIASNYLYTIE